MIERDLRKDLANNIGRVHSLTLLEAEKEVAMDVVYPYLIVFLAGIATPFVALRGLIGNKTSDGSGCLLNICIAGFALLILFVAYFWLLVP